MCVTLFLHAQLDDKIVAAGHVPQYHDGMRVTDDDTMRYLKETSGSARFEIESSLARGFRGRPGQSGISVVSGNFFYSAKPLGVRGGVDFKLTGEVRRVEVDNLKKRLEAGDVVLLTSLGYSPSGEVFNVPSESLAAECAAKMQAAKVIYLTEGEALVDNRSGKPVQSLRLAQAISLLDKCGVSEYIQAEDQAHGLNYGHGADGASAGSGSGDVAFSSFTKTAEELSEERVAGMSAAAGRKAPSASSSASAAVAATTTAATATTATGGDSHEPPEQEQDLVPLGRGVDLSRTSAAVAGFVRLLSRCVYALSGGVRRAHLLSPGKGAILKELYTRDGAGILVSRDVYDGILQAQVRPEPYPHIRPAPHTLHARPLHLALRPASRPAGLGRAHRGGDHPAARGARHPGASAHIISHALYPAPSILHPAPCTLHPIPCTLYPFALVPMPPDQPPHDSPSTSWCIRPHHITCLIPCTLHPAPCTLHPIPCTLYPFALVPMPPDQPPHDSPSTSLPPRRWRGPASSSRKTCRTAS